MAGVVQSISSPPGDSHTFEQLPEAIEALEHGKDIDYRGRRARSTSTTPATPPPGFTMSMNTTARTSSSLTRFRSIAARNMDGRLPRAARS